MGKTVLVAGGSGELGRHVVRCFQAAGWRVRALTRARNRAPPEAHEVFEAHALQPTSLRGSCDGVDAVFSSLGASVALGLAAPRAYTRVDTPGNLALLEEAKRAGTSRFVYVSVAHTEPMKRLAYIRAHEDFAEALSRSGLDACIVRPTGFFSAFRAYSRLARAGVVPVFGSGEARSNPIDDAELAEVCVSATEGSERALTVGGPQVLSRRQIAEQSFEGLGRRPRTLALPTAVLKGSSLVLRALHPRLSQLMAFVASVSEQDVVVPAHGKRTLLEFLRHDNAAARA